MRSSAKTVTSYLKEIPAEQKAAVRKLRDLCRAKSTSFKESTDYGGPVYSRSGDRKIRGIRWLSLRNMEGAS